jgi:hypothetical protein
MQDQNRTAVAREKIESDQNKAAAEIASRERTAMIQTRTSAATDLANIESDERQNTQDNATAMAIAEGEWENAEKVAVKTGTGINKNPGA